MIAVAVKEIELVEKTATFGSAFIAIDVYSKISLQVFDSSAGRDVFKQSSFCSCFPGTVAEQSKARTVFARSDAVIMGLNPT
jgi:hypothetical protein